MILGLPNLDDLDDLSVSIRNPRLQWGKRIVGREVLLRHKAFRHCKATSTDGSCFFPLALNTVFDFFTVLQQAQNLACSHGFTSPSSGLMHRIYATTLRSLQLQYAGNKTQCMTKVSLASLCLVAYMSTNLRVSTAFCVHEHNALSACFFATTHILSCRARNNDVVHKCISSCVKKWL